MMQYDALKTRVVMNTTKIITNIMEISSIVYYTQLGDKGKIAIFFSATAIFPQLGVNQGKDQSLNEPS